MPLYEYRCEDCGAQFAALQPMSAPRTGAECTRCGSVRTRRVLSTFATQSASPSGGGSVRAGDCAPSG